MGVPLMIVGNKVLFRINPPYKTYSNDYELIEYFPGLLIDNIYQRFTFEQKTWFFYRFLYYVSM